MSSRKVTGPTLSLRIRRKHASRWAASSGACGSGAGVVRVLPSGAGTNLALLAGTQAADVAMMLGKDQQRYDEDDRQPSPASDGIVEGDGDGSCQRRQRGIARGHGDGQPHEAKDQRRQPVRAKEHTDKGG